MTDNEIRILTGLRPGDIGRIIELHGVEYEPAQGYGVRFEAFVARTLAEFVLDDDGIGRIWMAERDGRLEGCAAIVHRPGNAGQLRWVLLGARARGQGLGRQLVETALAYCRERGFERVYLETTDGLDASSALYRSLGFNVVAEQLEDLWDGRRPLIIMELQFRPEPAGSEPPG
jgi:GNAT superfamily N-acetyltransferase